MTPDERAIRQLVEDWMAASKAGDTAKILSLMTEDALFMVPSRAPFGKAAFAESSKAMSPGKIEGTSAIQEIRVLGDWAYMRNYLEMTITPQGGEPVKKSGYTLSVLQKGPDGQWRLMRDANLLA